MKKERIFYLDFVRAIAVVLILMTHYNAVYLYAEQPDKVFITARLEIFISEILVCHCSLLPDAALMYVYDEKCELINFYKKRFLSIYPMFWIAYFICVPVSVLCQQGNRPDGAETQYLIDVFWL